MGAYILGILASVLSALVVFLIKKLSDNFAKFVTEQRAQNQRNNEFQRSMQRAEINRYFRIVVEQGSPISPEELKHVTKCYEAYHDNGGNGVGTIMYERICEHSRLVTQVKEL